MKAFGNNLAVAKVRVHSMSFENMFLVLVFSPFNFSPALDWRAFPSSGYKWWWHSWYRWTGSLTGQSTREVTTCYFFIFSYVSKLVSDLLPDVAVSLIMLPSFFREPLISNCPVCGEDLGKYDKINDMIHMTLCFDEGTGNQIMTGGFLTDKQASYG